MGKYQSLCKGETVHGVKCNWSCSAARGPRWKGDTSAQKCMSFPCVLHSQPVPSTLFLQLLGPGTSLGNGPVPVLGGNKPRPCESSSSTMGTGARARARASHVWPPMAEGPTATLTHLHLHSATRVWTLTAPSTSAPPVQPGAGTL